jgi:hypothetical protein
MTDKHEDITVILVNKGSTFAEGDVLIDNKRVPCARFEIKIDPFRQDDMLRHKYGEYLILHIPMHYVTIEAKEGSIEVK